MRVVFLKHRYWPAVGGVEKYKNRLFRAQQEIGHRVLGVTGAHTHGLADPRFWGFSPKGACMIATCTETMVSIH